MTSNTQSEVSAIYTRLLNHTVSVPSMLIAFVWGMAEATFFFVVPDVYLGFIALLHPRRALMATMMAVGGAIPQTKAISIEGTETV